MIRRAIREDSLVFLACFSQQSVDRARSFQNEELVLAVDELRLRPVDRPWLIPVRLDDCQIPDREIGGGQTLADLQRADLFGDDYEQNADRLVTAIRRILRHGPAAEPATGAARAALAGTGSGRPPKYSIDLRGAQGIQIGDGNIQHNTF